MIIKFLFIDKTFGKLEIVKEFFHEDFKEINRLQENFADEVFSFTLRKRFKVFSRSSGEELDVENCFMHFDSMMQIYFTFSVKEREGVYKEVNSGEFSFTSVQTRFYDWDGDTLIINKDLYNDEELELSSDTLDFAFNDVFDFLDSDKSLFLNFINESGTIDGRVEKSLAILKKFYDNLKKERIEELNKIYNVSLVKKTNSTLGEPIEILNKYSTTIDIEEKDWCRIIRYEMMRNEK